MARAQAIVVVTNCGSEKEARRIARALVERRLAACVNTFSAPIESVYRWKGKIETAKEFTLLVKTTRARLPAVDSAIRELHSYDVPEIIALPIAAGSKDYLAWLIDSVGKRAKEPG
jgi:periplasmic divalent cation tolerance protein